MTLYCYNNAPCQVNENVPRRYSCPGPREVRVLHYRPPVLRVGRRPRRDSAPARVSRHTNTTKTDKTLTQGHHVYRVGTLRHNPFGSDYQIAAEKKKKYACLFAAFVAFREEGVWPESTSIQARQQQRNTITASTRKKKKRTGNDEITRNGLQLAQYQVHVLLFQQRLEHHGEAQQGLRHSFSSGGGTPPVV